MTQNAVGASPRQAAVAQPVAGPPGVEDHVRKFRSHHGPAGAAALARFLPDPDDPLYLDVLRELIRIDLGRGPAPAAAEEYQRAFPEAFADPDWVARLAAPAGPRGADLAAGCRSFDGGPASAQLARELHEADAEGTVQLAEAAAAAPQVGTDFHGFRLLGELGSGAFGRVYLARQLDLADRHVVLKVSADAPGEARTLAQLLHTNVVPIYSVHREGPLYAVCMPYLGPTTLADVLKEVAGRLPASGKALVSALHDRGSTVRTGKTAPDLVLPSGEPAPPAPGQVPEAPAPHEVGSTILLEKLAGLSYVDAVLWIAARLADGLAHAHERGIVHRDLKPANILLTDEGQPMLLDFNLAEDSKLRASAPAAQVGGTLPYMSPEQLRAFRGEGPRPDGRSDVYALGVILFELLCGLPPFPRRGGAVRAAVEAMLQDRAGPPPRLRGRNRAVTPAAEAIVRRCLEPDATRRYQSARELQEDLQRHLDDLPLRHTPEPSARERLRKWARRHPRLASTSSVLALAAAVVFALAAAFVYRGQRLAELEAAETFNRFRDEATEVQFQLTHPGAGRADLAAPLALGGRALARYRILDGENWAEAPAVEALPPAQRQQLREEAGVLLLLLARGHALRAADAEGPDRDRGGREALRLNALAETCYAPGEGPGALWSQRADLLASLGQAADAERLRERAAKSPPDGPRGHYLAGRELAVQGRFAEALPALQQAARLDPQTAHAWFLLARCHDGLGRDADAAACLTTCIALWPRDHRPYFNRGLAYLRLRDFRRAAADFDEVIRQRPDTADAYVNRALAREALGEHRAALDDLGRALEGGAPYTRVYFLRARVKERLGDKAGAKADRAEGLRREPSDEHSWVARGMARLRDNPEAALADFAKALQANPRSLPALHNQAHVLAERLGRTAEAVTLLDRALALHPDHVGARSSRGVLLARLGRREAAHRDAAEALRRSAAPATAYQVAGIYALTSRLAPADRRDALRHLAAALRQGYGHDLLARDDDLAPVRDTAEFRRLVDAARALRDFERP